MIDSDESVGAGEAQAPRVRIPASARDSGASHLFFLFIYLQLSVSDRISFRPSGLP